MSLASKLRFLEEVFSGDEEVVDFMWRAIGYSLTGDISEQCLFILCGEGSNGKTTMLEIILRVLGTHAVTTPFATFLLQRDAGNPRNDVAALHGARLAKAAEAQHRARLDEALIKQITGGDTITARFLYGELFSFTPQFKLWLATNHVPEIRGTDDAIWRRIRLIPFRVQFNHQNMDKQLMPKLEELPAGSSPGP